MPARGSCGPSFPSPVCGLRPGPGRTDGIAPLHDTLVLSPLTHDDVLLDALLAEPTIANLYIGDHPTCWMAPGVPHDSYLSDFLMRSKAVIGAP